jgi:hypothetical protein
MKIEQTTKITQITHEDLVNLFSTALSGSYYLSAEYNKEFYNKLPIGKINGDCFEDKLADTVLNGGEIYFFDNEADGECYSSFGEVMDDDTVMYTLKMDNISKGLENAFNESYDTDSGKYVRECSNDLIEDDGINLDLNSADALMQYIMFGTLIYG